MQEFGRDDARAAERRVAVDRGRLMRILAVAEFALVHAAQFEHRREAIAGALAHPCGDGRVVGRRAGERGGCKRAAKLERRRAFVLGELAGDGVVLRRIGHHGDELMVLRGRAQHRRSADIDLLDRLVLLHAFAAHRHFEGIEIHADEVDRWNPVLFHRLHVLGYVAPAEQSAVNPRMQRLHPAVHHLGEACELLDGNDRNAGCGERVRGAAGRDDLDPERRERAGEGDEITLVADRDQRATDADDSMHGGFLRGSLSRSSRPAPSRPPLAARQPSGARAVRCGHPSTRR